MWVNSSKQLRKEFAIDAKPTQKIQNVKKIFICARWLPRNHTPLALNSVNRTFRNSGTKISKKKLTSI